MSDRVSTSDVVLAQLREGILQGEFVQGRLYSIYELAERFGVSRTPVRDAVLRLADARMVEIVRNRGVRIRGLSAADVRAIFELRVMLEVPAASYAAAHRDAALDARLDELLSRMREAARADDTAAFSRHDRALHREILSAMGNERLLDTVDALRDATQSMGVSTMNRSRRLSEVEVEHVPIVEAIEAGASALAGERMREHLERTADLLVAQLTAEDA